MTALASFEDIIYIIIGLLWVAFSFYNAKKKKNAKKVPTPANKQKSMLESLLNEIRDEDQKNDPSLYEPAQEIDQHEEEPMHIEKEIFSYFHLFLAVEKIRFYQMKSDSLVYYLNLCSLLIDDLYILLINRRLKLVNNFSTILIKTNCQIVQFYE